MKLSNAQLRVLRLMPIVKKRWAGPEGPTFMAGDMGRAYSGREIPLSTYCALLDKGLIFETKTVRAYPDTWEVMLTPAGLETLAEAGGGRDE